MGVKDKKDGKFYRCVRTLKRFLYIYLFVSTFSSIIICNLRLRELKISFSEIDNHMIFNLFVHHLEDRWCVHMVTLISQTDDFHS